MTLRLPNYQVSLSPWVAEENSLSEVAQIEASSTSDEEPCVGPAQFLSSATSFSFIGKNNFEVSTVQTRATVSTAQIPATFSTGQMPAALCTGQIPAAITNIQSKGGLLMDFIHLLHKH
ncbi:hypothetical protein M0R45_033355 [Rubus argutus]|uniref:Uncharacterized protein n=1 Tax=Rubus argutus TaxID=59490 RepID=A0AAW1WJK5_RUBAR